MPTKTEDLKDTRPDKGVKKPSKEKKKFDLAKTFVKSNDLDSAKKVLAELADHPNPFQLKAAKMLEEIE